VAFSTTKTFCNIAYIHLRKSSSKQSPGRGKSPDFRWPVDSLHTVEYGGFETSDVDTAEERGLIPGKTWAGYVGRELPRQRTR